MKLSTTEPVALQGAVTAVLPAVFALLAAFDVWDPTEEQTAALAGVLAAVIAAWSAFTRQKVWPSAHVDELATNLAHAQGQEVLEAKREAAELKHRVVAAEGRALVTERDVSAPSLRPPPPPPPPPPPMTVGEHKATRRAGG